MSSSDASTPVSMSDGSEISLHEDASSVASEGQYLALGTITIYERCDDGLEPKTMMCNRNGSEPYPAPWMALALRREWIHLEEMATPDKGVARNVRVYALPEDVDRSNRGSLKDFRKTMKQLLGCMNCSISAWLGRIEHPSTWKMYETPRALEEESLFYIFNTLQSPKPDLDCFTTSTYGYQSVHDVMNDSVVGLKTQLYPYQKRSIAAMVQRESEPAKILDPRKPLFSDIYGRPFYLDIGDGALLQNPPLYNEPQGGILAETMGYGKTLICIALVLATLGHYPKVPEDRIDSVPFKPREKVGSLLAMSARRAKHEGIPWKSEFGPLNKSGYQYDRCLNELKKYDRAYAEPIFTPTTPERKGKRESANIVRLCSATLVIVPPNLLVQWQNEIKKHTAAGALDVLVIDSPTKEVPPWQELLKYDIVIITKARFEQEYRDDDLNQGKSRRGDSRYRSSLTDVRWLRVICDEGHGFAGSSSRTNAIAMLDKMFIERRWVVSGTPSSTLHGVEVGLSTTSTSTVDSTPSSPASDPASARKNSLSTALQKRRTPNAREIEVKDLERLRLIVVNFLRLQPWANQRGSSDVANWKKYLAPFVEDGHRHTPMALREVLQTLILRHRIEDIDTDLTLPPLHNRVVYLEPSYHDKLAINMFFLVLTSNYVTSEREDEDYMFHPRNRKKLDQLINNMRQASFHWVGFTQHDIQETLRISNEYFNNNIDKISDSDGALLTEAILNGEQALSDPSWIAFSTLHEIGVYINDFPEHAQESWALDGTGDDPVLLGTVQAREAQKYMRSRFSKSPSDVLSSFAGAGVRVMNAAKSRAEDEQKALQTAKAKVNESEKQQVGITDEPKLKSPSISLATWSQSPIRKKRRRNSSLTTSSAVAASPSSLLTPPASPHTVSASTSPSQTTTSTPLPTTTISSFTSSKLTYLISRLLNLPPRTKSLVFYQHNNTAFFIAEALELLSIPHRIYANTLSVTQRNAYLSDFNAESSEIQVLLMDVKQASLGLHIACASYVCIVSPIWNAGVESQAIKRAHRIGQTKEVIVETLVLENTFEEEMVRRRKWKDENLDVEDEDDDDMTSTDVDEDNDQENSSDTITVIPTTTLKKSKSRNPNAEKSLLDDRHMVNVLKDIKFLKFTPEEKKFGGRARAKTSEMLDVPVKRRSLFGGDNSSNTNTEVIIDNDKGATGKIEDKNTDNTAEATTVHVMMKKKEEQSQEESPDASAEEASLRVKFRKLCA